jgi:excisionase family DNA binding protein
MAKKNHIDPATSSGTSPTPVRPAIQPRGFRIEDAAAYTALSPWFISEAVRNKLLPALKPEGSRNYVILREDLDKFLDDLRARAA